MNKYFKYLYFIHFLNDGFYASFILLLPFIAHDFKINLTQVGLLGTAMNFLQILVALPAGYFALKIGGLKLLLIGLFLCGLGFFGIFTTPSYLFLLLVYIISGIGVSLFHPVAFALVAKLSDKEKRGTQMGNFTAIGDIGKIGISTVVTFFAALIGWRFTSLGQALIAFITITFLYRLIFVKSPPIVIDNPSSVISAKLKDFFKNKKFILTIMAGGLDSFASSALFVFLPFLLLKRGISPAVLGAFTATFFAGNLLGKFMLGRFSDKLGTKKIFIIAEILMAVFILILANSASLPIIIVSSIILGFFTKGTSPVVQTMISESVEHHGYFDKAYALYYLILGAAVTLAPITLGFFSDKFGIVSAFGISALFALLATIPAAGLLLMK